VIATLAVENYRSLRSLIVPLAELTVVSGANGTGKSSLYRALRLLGDTARNGAVAALAREGGLPSTLWAGPETIGRAVREGAHPVQGTVRTKSVALRLGFGGDEFGYAIDFGLPVGGGRSLFALDPEIKRETIWTGPLLRPAAALCERDNGIVRIRGDRRAWSEPYQIRPYDSMLSEFADPGRAPEVLRVREQIRGWRFYDHIRTDAAAPARRTQIGTRTPVLSHDGADLAAALQTIRETGDGDALDQTVDLAFPGSRVTVVGEGEGRLGLRLHQHGLLRPLGAAELSDGTLRYLLWAAALLAPRPAGLLVLNEPETSLHWQLLAPLAQLITAAAARSQTIAVSHSQILISALRRATEEAGTLVGSIELTKDFGETRVAGQDRLDGPAWRWPKRLQRDLESLLGGYWKNSSGTEPGPRWAGTMGIWVQSGRCCRYSIRRLISASAWSSSSPGAIVIVSVTAKVPMLITSSSGMRKTAAVVPDTVARPLDPATLAIDGIAAAWIRSAAIPV
jgi:predicted ATPase